MSVLLLKSWLYLASENEKELNYTTHGWSQSQR